MHMADALLSPVVGASMWAATAATIAVCSSKVKRELDDRKVPLMGVLGAFIFAAQMINFTIPGTGSSGHLGGGLLLAVLLGPWAALVVLASVLTVQALFFADGGLLALGCNVFNLGFFPCFVAYPLIYRRLVGERPTQARLMGASVLAAVLGLELGALGVVLQTTLSGVAELPFKAFALMMLPIHLGIGMVEGVVTAMVIAFVWRVRPEILDTRLVDASSPVRSWRRVLVALSLVALVTGGALSWMASENPDGLEWAIQKVTAEQELEAPAGGTHETLARVQEKTALLPDYSLRQNEEPASRFAPQAGTSLAGVVGGLLTMGVALVVGILLKRRSGRKA